MQEIARLPSLEILLEFLEFLTARTLITYFSRTIPGLQANIAIEKTRGGGVLPYITYIGMCRCEGYGFQAVWSGIGYRNQGVLV